MRSLVAIEAKDLLKSLLCLGFGIPTYLQLDKHSSGGSRGESDALPSPFFFLFPYSFRQRLCKIIGQCLPYRVGSPL